MKNEFIEFPKSVKRLFAEITRKHQRELNEILRDVYEELGVLERLENQQKSGEKFSLRPNYAGLDIITPAPPKKVTPRLPGKNSRKVEEVKDDKKKKSS